jgi:hypothetical protein
MQLHPHAFEILNREAILQQGLRARLPEDRLTIIAVKEGQELALDVVAGPREVATTCHATTLRLNWSSPKRTQPLQHTEDDNNP